MRVRFPALLTLAWACAAAPPAARALDVEMLIPPAPRIHGVAAPTAPGPAADPNADIDPDEVLVPRVAHVRFRLSDAARPVRPFGGGEDGDVSPDAVDNGVVALAGALASPSSALSRAVRDALDGPLTWGELDALSRAATDAARRYGWSLAWAYAPEQELTGGVLTVRVLMVRLEGVEVRGSRWSRPKRLKRGYAKHAGEVVHFDDYRAPHAFMNQHPFRTVTPSVKPGDAEATSRIVLDVDERRRFRLFGGYETTHSRHSGHGRAHGGVSFAVPYFTEDIWTLQYSVDDDFDHLHSVASVYRAALPWGHFLTGTALWSRSETSPDPLLDQRNRDTLFRLAYAIPLPAAGGWTHQFDFGWEWRRTKVDTYWAGTRAHTHTYDAAPFFVGYRGHMADRFGLTTASADILRGWGGWLGDKMDRATYDLHRAGADPYFTVYRADIGRNWRLPWDFRLHQRGWGQYTSQRMTGATQWYLGGNRTIRGYRESEVAGDYGFAFSQELLTPNLLGALRPPDGEPAWDLRLAGFWDFGKVYRRSARSPGEPRRTILSGGGVGVRARYGDRFDARVEYARRIRDTGIPADDRDGYWHVSVNLAY